MAFSQKNWQFNDIITEGELNRIEQGISDAHQIGEQAQATADTANQKADQNASALVAHLNDNVRHVTQAEKDNWNNKVSKNGDTMIGPLIINSIFSIQFDSPSGYKSWTIHKPNNNSLIFAPRRDDNTDWDWTSQILFDKSSIALGMHPNITGILTGDGSPEGNVTANVGSIYMRRDGGASTTLYVKESGTGNTGWKAVQTA